MCFKTTVYLILTNFNIIINAGELPMRWGFSPLEDKIPIESNP